MSDPAGTAGPPRRTRGVGPFSLRQVALAVGAVAVTGLILVAVTTPLGRPAPTGPVDPRATAFIIASPTTGFAPGERPPEFEVTRPDGSVYQLLDLDGQPVRLDALRGQGVWVNFWATWCPPCQAETPTLRDVYAEYRERGLVLVAVDVQETVEDARAYAERYGLEYTIGTDVTGEIFRAWRVFALPTQFFIGPDGLIRTVVQGPLEPERAAELVESILPER